MTRAEEMKLSKVFKGLLSCTTARLQLLALQLKIDAWAKLEGILGQIRAERILQTPTGGLLQVRVDQVAQELLGGGNFDMRIGTSGRVRFRDPHRAVKTTSTEEKHAKAQEKVLSLRKQLEEAEKMTQDLVDNKALGAAIQMDAIELEDGTAEKELPEERPSESNVTEGY